MSFTFERLSSSGPWEPLLIGSLFADKDLCGVSANRGLLRFHDASSGPRAQEFVKAAFGPRGLSADVFAFDWLARQFAVTTQITPDGTITNGGGRTVVVLDPFDMSVTPWVPIEDFEHALSTPLAQTFLRDKLFGAWLRAKGLRSLGFDRCAGATVPGFYRGEISIANLDNNDIDVYLTFIEQLWQQAQQQAPGTRAPHIATGSDR